MYHIVSGAQHDLAGHTDQVLALAAANNCLFSGGKDQSIRVWRLDLATKTFAPSVRLFRAPLACDPPHRAGMHACMQDWPDACGG